MLRRWHMRAYSLGLGRCLAVLRDLQVVTMRFAVGRAEPARNGKKVICLRI